MLLFVVCKIENPTLNTHDSQDVCACVCQKYTTKKSLELNKKRRDQTHVVLFQIYVVFMHTSFPSFCSVQGTLLFWNAWIDFNNENYLIIKHHRFSKKYDTNK